MRRPRRFIERTLDVIDSLGRRGTGDRETGDGEAGDQGGETGLMGGQCPTDPDPVKELRR